MKNVIRISFAAQLVLCPAALFAGTECKVVEFPDRYEAICTGDEKNQLSNRSLPSVTSVAVSVAAKTSENQVKSFSSPAVAAAASMARPQDPKQLSSAVAKNLTYRKNRLQRSDVEAKQTIRRQNILAGRTNETVAPQNDSFM